MTTRLDDLLAYGVVNRDRFRSLLCQVKDRFVVPFVGAGMSRDSRYPLWRDFVCEMGKRASIHEEVQSLLVDSDYEGALERVHEVLEDCLTRDEIRRRFGPSELGEDRLRGAVLRLPALAPGAVITTNYDCVLENVFRHAHCQFVEVVFGGQTNVLREAVKEALFENKRILLKIHGTFNRTDGQLVTRRDYDSHYGKNVDSKFDPDLPLPKLLLRIFGSRPLLFLGCSLAPDRIMALLRHLHKPAHDATPDHFALLPGEATDVRTLEREKFLMSHSIKPIFYPPGEHAAVETLLAALAEPRRPRPRGPQAYDVTAHEHMLRRERLTKQDIESGLAVKPRQVEEVVQALKEGKSVAVQGPPGSGKSALAAWVGCIAAEHGLVTEFFSGRSLQEKDAEAACGRLERVPSEDIIIVDDIHLVEPVLAHMKSLPWSGKRRFLLLGRTPYVEKALRGGRVPKIHKELINIAAEDSMYVAEALATQYLGKDTATRLLRRTGKDLVFTKWILEAVVLDHAPPDCTPEQAAAAKLKSIRNDGGNKALRLFLTLAAFSWTELWCPEVFLADVLGFEVDTMERLLESLYEAERQTRPEAQEGYALRLLRHPKLCELFLDAAPGLGFIFDRFVFAPTCAALKLDSEAVKSYRFAPLILGAAVTAPFADLLSIEWRLVYGGRSSDYVDVVKVAAELLLARDKGRLGPKLPLDAKARCLEFAFAAANGERRLHGGQAGKALLEELRQRFGVLEIPAEMFAQKGYILYQDAYLMRLNNAGEPALTRFEESAEADEAWAVAKDSALHRGKASMSRIAAAAYNIDLAVFAETTTGTLHPDHARLRAALGTLTNALGSLDKLLTSKIDQKDQRKLVGFRKNALLHLAQAAGWLGDERAVGKHLRALEPGAQLDDSTQRAIGLAKGALALAEGRYEQVIAELQGQPQERVALGTGEDSGKTGAMLLVSYLQVGRREDAEAMRCCLLSDQCPADAGNGLAKVWTARLPRVHDMF